MELLLTLSSLRCFDLEPTKKFKDSNLSQMLNKYTPLNNDEASHGQAKSAAAAAEDMNHQGGTA